MRRILYVYLLLVCGGALSLTSAQPLDYSYVRSRVMTDAAGTGYMEHTDYDNGLGQLFQQVDAGISPTHKDLVTLYEYDGFRRQTHQWLPAPLSGSGSWQSPNTVKSAVSQAMSDTSPYTETSYEQNPLERMSERSLPGAAWRQSQRKMTFSRFLSRNSNLGGNAIGFAGYYNYVFFNYSDDKSMVESVIDEDGTTIQTYRDLDGNVCAVRKLSGAETLETDYAYDIWGNLRYVLPPEASSYYQANHAYGPSSGDAVFQQFVYEYRYDGRHNCIYKKLPGCDPVYYVYDKADRCILSQDGAQRAKGQWSYTIPDVFGRPVMTGVCHNTLTYTALPLSNTVVCAARSSSGSCGYTVSGITLSSDTVYTVTYYDDYAFIGSNGVPSSLTYAAPPSGGYGIQGISAPRGLATGSVTARVTSTGVTGYDYAAMYYDDRGRMVQTRSTNHLGGCDCVYTGYDFTGKVLRECHTHQKSGGSVTTETVTTTYDHAGRLLTRKHRLNNGSEVTLQSNTYDEWGRLTGKTTGGTLTTAYTYNLRSWLKSITVGTLFSESLYYNESHDGNTPRWGGDVSAMDWKADSKTRGYVFSYDGFSRLTQASYSENGVGNGHYNTEYTYDRMGNVQTLKRYGLQDNSQYGMVDNLSYTYDGNQVTKVTDAVSGPNYCGAFHFRDGANATLEYEYDQNGNMTKDLNKNISSIQYNLLNLPSSINYQSGNMASYVYSASGAKLSVTYTNGATATTNQYCGNMLYENGTLKQILIDGGYITFSGTTPQYHFYLKDHLGNNRVVVSAGGTVEQVNHYYPYGGLMGESTNGDLQRFKYNGKELDRMHGLDWYDYGARHMSADIGRFTTQDRYAEKYYDTSPYVYCKDNPIKRIDINGDSTVVDIYGKVVHNDDKDKAVYLYYNKKTEKIGEKGGKINVNKILPRTLRRNSNEAKQIKSIITFIKNVKTGGNWDLKNNTKTIWGLAKNSTFLYNKQNLSSEDVGNMNFGVVAKSYGFSQETALRGAGLYQIYERHSTSEWINGTTITAYRANQFGIVSPVSVEVLGSPYGDDPRDQYWINQGYNFK